MYSGHQLCRGSLPDSSLNCTFCGILNVVRQERDRNVATPCEPLKFVRRVGEDSHSNLQRFGQIMLRCLGVGHGRRPPRCLSQISRPPVPGDAYLTIFASTSPGLAGAACSDPAGIRWRGRVGVSTLARSALLLKRIECAFSSLLAQGFKWRMSIDELVPFRCISTRFGGNRQLLTCLRCGRHCSRIFGGPLFPMRQCHGLEPLAVEPSRKHRPGSFRWVKVACVHLNIMQ